MPYFLTNSLAVSGLRDFIHVLNNITHNLAAPLSVARSTCNNFVLCHLFKLTIVQKNYLDAIQPK